MNLRAQNDTAGAAAVEPVEVATGRSAPEGTAELLGSAATDAPAKSRSGLRPLASLLPYIGRYRGRALAAFGALVLAAVTTLVVPIAARRMIDFGFTERGLNLINSYFLVMIGIAARARLCQRLALLPRHHAWRAHRRRFAQRRIRASDLAVGCLLRRRREPAR